jgi:DNA-directed RNA polymerase specialized sigma24 family protein
MSRTALFLIIHITCLIFMDSDLNNNFDENDASVDKDLDPTIPLKQNFGITQSEFDVLVARLKAGDESMFEKIFLAHFNYCISYLKKNYNAQYDAAYDVTMDTLIEFRYRLLLDKISYGNLRYLFTKIACQQYVKTISKDYKQEDNIFEDCENDDNFEDKLETLKLAWLDLGFEERKLLESVYYLDIPLIKIASVTSKTDATLRKQKQRAMEKLRNLFFNIYNKLE